MYTFFFFLSWLQPKNNQQIAFQYQSFYILLSENILIFIYLVMFCLTLSSLSIGILLQGHNTQQSTLDDICHHILSRNCQGDKTYCKMCQSILVYMLQKNKSLFKIQSSTIISKNQHALYSQVQNQNKTMHNVKK